MATVTINSLEIDIYKLPMLKRLNLDRKVAQMVLPILGSLEKLNISAIANAIMAPEPEDGAVQAAEQSLADGMDIGTILSAVERALGSLSDAEFEKLAAELLSVTSVRHPVFGNVLLDNNDKINNTLAELAPIDIYRLCIEVMRENKFSPFVFVGGGAGTRATATSAPASSMSKKRGLKLPGKRD